MTEVDQKDTAIYGIKLTKIPEEERLKLMERIEKEIQAKVSELKTSSSPYLGNINCSIGFVSTKYQGEDCDIRVYFSAICDNYSALTTEINKIFSSISTLREEFYTPHSVARIKDFGTKSSRHRPFWL